MTEIFSGIYGRGAVQGELSDAAFIRAMLDVEVALATALERHGLAHVEAVAEIRDACRDAGAFDAGAIGRAGASSGTPVPALLAAVRERLGEPAAATLHRGATSQDIVDSALMLVARRSLAPLLSDLANAAASCAALARAHRKTVAAGRTLLQQAPPVTFALKAATWLRGLDLARTQLEGLRADGLPVQLGGAVGTLAVLGDAGLAVASTLAEELGLAAPPLPWHTVRVAPARLACALGEALGVMAKISRDLTLLAQTEVAEAAEAAAAGRGGSSTLPHKRNPVGAVAVLACAQRGPGLVATILSAMAQEHERAAGAWQGEWGALLELLGLAGSAASSLAETLPMLEVDSARMRDNLDPLVMAESVVAALGGGTGARRLLAEAARTSASEGRPLGDLLLESADVRDRLGPDGVEKALDPARYLGVADQLVDRALAEHEGVLSPGRR
ncbi:MAG: hypothetical protein JO153_10420 [Solirubrobacterales bacterium]|nr:hypothetical protein [Solirubrobacterales bacterium]